MTLRTYNTIFLLTLSVFIVYSACFLTTKPRLWIDEALTIGVARGFAEDMILDISDRPGGYSGFGMLLQQTGYPVTIPLAFAIKIFGLSPETARVFMMLIAIGALILIWQIGPKMFGRPATIASLLLIISFASFHNARTAVGDLPGFIFMLAGLYFWFERRQLSYAGILLGLAVVTKPSVYALIIPAVVIMFLFRRIDAKDVAHIAIGMLPAGLLWVFLSTGNPLTGSYWQAIAGFYANPYGSDISANIIANLKNLAHSSTLVYFGLIFVVVLVARIWKIRGRESLIYDFALVYGALALVYFLRSPGWLRYLIGAELLVLFLLPNILYKFNDVSERFFGAMKIFRGGRLISVVLGGLVIVQFLQLWFFADIFYSQSVGALVSRLNEQYKDKIIFFINAPEPAVFAHSENRYSLIRLLGVPEVGRDILKEDIVPDVIVSSRADDSVILDSRSFIDEFYEKVDWGGGYTVFELKKS